MNRFNLPRLVLGSTLIATSGLGGPPTSDAGDLPRGSPEEQGVASSAVLGFVEAADERINSLHSLMLVRHGHVVAEGWWGPYDAETPHVLYSLSKSFTATAVGLAVAEGTLSLDDEVIGFFPEIAPSEPSANLRAMRVRDLLRMSAGHQVEATLWRGDGASGTWAERFLEHPVPFKPGTHFLYNSPGSYMLSAIVQRVTGTTVLDYLRPRLFEPLGIEDPTWVASPEGVSAGGFGLSVRTEDIARFGQLYLQGGKWEGRQLVPSSWVREATSLQTSNGSNPQSDWEQGYGYQFWRCRHEGYRGDGAFGQYCIVLPDEDAVIAITGGVSNMQEVLDLVWEHLLPALQSGTLPEDADAREALQAKLDGLTMRLPDGQSTSPLAAEVSGRFYEFPDNDRGIGSLALELDAEPPALIVRDDEGETRTPIGIGSWAVGGKFADGLDAGLGVPDHPLVAASGAWASDDVFTLTLCLYETPFTSTMTFHFDGDRLLVDAEHNVAFGPKDLPQLVGRASAD